MNWLAQAGVGWLIAALFELVLHWFPWRLALKRNTPWVCVAGVLGMAIPFGGLLLLWIKDYQPLPLTPYEIIFRTLIAFWGMIIFTVAAILSGYAIDWLLIHLRLAEELQELMELNNDTSRQIGNKS